MFFPNILGKQLINALRAHHHLSLLAVIEPEFSDDEPAALSVTTLAADIAADEAATETVDAIAQREKDMAGAAAPAGN